MLFNLRSTQSFYPFFSLFFYFLDRLSVSSNSFLTLSIFYFILSLLSIKRWELSPSLSEIERRTLRKFKSSDLFTFFSFFCLDLKRSLFFYVALWVGITKNPHCSAGPLAHPFVVCLRCSLCCTHSFTRSLTLLTPKLVGQWMAIGYLFCVFFYSGPYCVECL